MKIQGRFIVDPEKNGLIAIGMVALSTFLLSYSALLGPVSVLIFLGMWLPLPLIGQRRAIRVMRPAIVMLLLPTLAALSALWSDFPQNSLRDGLQYVSLALCAIIAATYVSVRSMVWGLLIGSHFVNLWSLASGVVVYDYFGNSFAFAGLFTSKNTFGFAASIGLLSTLSVLLLLRGRRFEQLVVAVASLQFVYGLVISDSATSLASMVGAAAALYAAIALRYVSRGVRLLLTIAPFVLMPLIAIAAIAAADELVELLGRDLTLTGRTELWLIGLSVFQDAPLLGVGFKGFWQFGVPLAEQIGIDYYFDRIPSFHFHNTYVGVMADLGIFGLVFLLIPLVSAIVYSVGRVQDRKTNRIGAICLSFTVLLFIRSFVEIDIFGAYVIGTFIFFYLGMLAWSRQDEMSALRRSYAGVSSALVKRDMSATAGSGLAGGAGSRVG